MCQLQRPPGAAKSPLRVKLLYSQESREFSCVSEFMKNQTKTKTWFKPIAATLSSRLPLSLLHGSHPEPRAQFSHLFFLWFIKIYPSFPPAWNPLLWFQEIQNGIQSYKRRARINRDTSWNEAVRTLESGPGEKTSTPTPCLQKPSSSPVLSRASLPLNLVFICTPSLSHEPRFFS